MRFSFILLLITLTGCYCPPISVQTEYLSHTHLASTFVQTPDPRQHHPYLGQRLIITWSLPWQVGNCEDLHMHITLRFRNREEQNLVIPISARSGTYKYDLMNDDFCRLGGIITYKIDIASGEQVITAWRHQLWTELITFDNQCEEPKPSHILP